MTAVVPTKLGPGTLKIGEVGTEVDMSCAVSAAGLGTEKDQDDPVPLLCGDNAQSPAEYSGTLTGTVLLDLADPDSIFFFSHTHKGEVHKVTFTPNTVAGTVVTGEVTIDPLEIAGDVKGNATADFEWDFVDFPLVTPPAGGGAAAAAASTSTGSERAPEPVGA